MPAARRQARIPVRRESERSLGHNIVESKRKESRSGDRRAPPTCPGGLSLATPRHARDPLGAGAGLSRPECRFPGRDSTTGVAPAASRALAPIDAGTRVRSPPTKAEKRSAGHADRWSDSRSRRDRRGALQAGGVRGWWILIAAWQAAVVRDDAAGPRFWHAQRWARPAWPEQLAQQRLRIRFASHGWNSIEPAPSAEGLDLGSPGGEARPSSASQAAARAAASSITPGKSRRWTSTPSRSAAVR